MIVQRKGAIEYRAIDRSVVDLITAIDGKEVRLLDELLDYVESKKPGTVVNISIIRANKKLVIPITLGKSKAV